jgi:hypothetical protein
MIEAQLLLWRFWCRWHFSHLLKECLEDTFFVDPVPTGQQLLDERSHCRNEATPLCFAKDPQTSEDSESPGSGDLTATLFVDEELGLELRSEDNGFSLTAVQHRRQLGNAGTICDGPPVDPGTLGDLRSARSSLPSAH